jgi:nitroreductase
VQDIVPEIVARRARRALSYRPIAQDVMDRMLEAATLAPSCFNNQPWRLVVVSDPERLERLKSALSSGNAWARRSPCIVAAVTNLELDCRSSDRRDYALFDVGLAVANLVLQGTREGLIAHPIAGYDPTVVKEALEVPESDIAVTLVILGYPGDEAALTEKQRAGERSERARKPLGEVAMRDRWGVAW